MQDYILLLTFGGYVEKSKHDHETTVVAIVHLLSVNKVSLLKAQQRFFAAFSLKARIELLRVYLVERDS